jgi:Ohr subfamily peroxiredoxin
MAKIDKVLLTGKTHTTANKPGDHNTTVNMKLSATGGKDIAFESVAAHPTAEQLFAGAWSSCYTLALGLAAEQSKVTLPASTSVDIEVDLGITGGAYFIGARFTVNLPGLDQEVASKVAHLADTLCPYSKAVHGNIDIDFKVTV